jgi:hypothetical protein
MTALLPGAALVAVVLWWWSPPSPIGRAEFDRLKLGMTSAEVIAAIGMPPGCYYSPPPGQIAGDPIRAIGLSDEDLRTRQFNPASQSERVTVQQWTWSRYWIWVAFDKDDRAVGLYLTRTLN